MIDRRQQWALAVIFLVIAVWMVGCDVLQTDGRQALREGLAEAEAAGQLRPVSVETLGGAAGLHQILGRDVAQTTAQVRGVRYALRSELRLETGAGETLEVQTRLRERLELRVSATGDYDLVHENTSSGIDDPERARGRRCRAVGLMFYTGREGGPMTALGDVVGPRSACLASAKAPLVEVLMPLLHRLEVGSSPGVSVLGRATLKVTFSPLEGQRTARTIANTWRDAEVHTPIISGVSVTNAARPLPRRPWLGTHLGVEAFSGHLMLDQTTGTPLSGLIEGRLRVRKGADDAVLVLRVTLAVEPFDGVIVPPERPRAWGPRPRLFEDRRVLLGAVGRVQKDHDIDPKVDNLPKPGDAPALKLKPEERGAALDEDRPSPSGDDDVEDAPR